MYGSPPVTSTMRFPPCAVSGATSFAARQPPVSPSVSNPQLGGGSPGVIPLTPVMRTFLAASPKRSLAYGRLCILGTFSSL